MNRSQDSWRPFGKVCCRLQSHEFQSAIICNNMHRAKKREIIVAYCSHFRLNTPHNATKMLEFRKLRLSMISRMTRGFAVIESLHADSTTKALGFRGILCWAPPKRQPRGRSCKIPNLPDSKSSKSSKKHGTETDVHHESPGRGSEVIQDLWSSSRMRSKGSRFTLGVWGLSCVRRTLRLRPQPFATVRARSLWPCLW